MKMLAEKEELLKKTIRNEMALNPFVSIRGMQAQVEKKVGHSISDKYACKLMRKIRTQAIVESDRTLMNERLAQIRERYHKFINDLTFIGYRAKGITYKDQLAALKLAARLDIALYKTELLTGAFTDQRRGTIELREEIIGVSRTLTIRPQG